MFFMTALIFLHNIPKFIQIFLFGTRIFHFLFKLYVHYKFDGYPHNNVFIVTSTCYISWYKLRIVRFVRPGWYTLWNYPSESHVLVTNSTLLFNDANAFLIPSLALDVDYILKNKLSSNSYVFPAPLFHVAPWALHIYNLFCCELLAGFIGPGMDFFLWSRPQNQSRSMLL